MRVLVAEDSRLVTPSRELGLQELAENTEVVYDGTAALEALTGSQWASARHS